MTVLRSRRLYGVHMILPDNVDPGQKTSHRYTGDAPEDQIVPGSAIHSPDLDGCKVLRLMQVSDNGTISRAKSKEHKPA